MRRSLAFIETHTVRATELKHALFEHVLELLDGQLPLPGAPRAAAGGHGAAAAGHGGGGGAAAAALAAAERSVEALPL